MPTGKLRYCWDSCVFISLLKGNDRTEEDLANLRKVERLVDDGEIVIFTSAITIIEVLECHLTQEQETAFRSLLRRSNVHPVSVSIRVAQRAREVRNYYQTKNIDIAVPDSIHIGTALLYEATALHTYDGCGRRKRKTDLLKLQLPLIEKYHLNICKPEPPPTDKAELEIEPDNLPAENMSLFHAMEEEA